MDIAVAGGTGTVGAAVAQVATERRHGVRILSRSSGIDVQSGVGLDDALKGADVVINVLGVAALNSKTATAFFRQTTEQLLASQHRMGVGHHILLSIVGIDRAPHGYYGAKLEQERLVQAGSTPWTIQRATQFHNFAKQMYQRAGGGPFRPALRMRTQPVDVREVAVRLVDLAEKPAAGRTRDLAGPREEELADMMRDWARHTGHRAWMPGLSLPGAFGRAMRNGDVLPGPDTDYGTVTFAEWLAAQPAQ